MHHRPKASRCGPIAIGNQSRHALPDEEQNPEKKRFMEEHGDGLGGVIYYGKSYTGSEASEAYDRGDFYW